MHITMSTKAPSDPQPKPIAAAPVRILHVVGGMERGGIETWLMHVLQGIDRREFHMDFLSHTPRDCAFDADIRALGSEVIAGPDPHRPWLYGREFKRILKSYGPYDVVHCHVHHFNGYVLRLAAAAGVPLRIAHSHNDTRDADARETLIRRFYMALMRRFIDRYATRRIGASGRAGAALFGESWTSDSRSSTMFYSIDLRPFLSLLDPESVRNELGIPRGSFVIGHAGRFVPQKNHSFLLRIFAEVVRSNETAVLLLLGAGPLREAIATQARHLGIADRIIFGGVRADVPRLMRAAMDLFLLPSLHEGLPVVLLEAQAAGLPCVISDVIAEESDAVRPLIHRLALRESPREWAEVILRARGRQQTQRSAALSTMIHSPFNLDNAIRALEELYRV
jgi:glycosyltransferase involved in cell wall biosynthesis